MQSTVIDFSPQGVGIIHLIGIGGIGMSGIAEILHNLGFTVQGSDLSDNANLDRLRESGIRVFVGQHEDNISGVSVVVKSSAVKDSNPEVQAARAKAIPVLKRAEMLAELLGLKSTVAIAGSHGKTTTTSFMAELFEAQALQPTVINGGIINARGTNAYLGKGDWLVAEADESDGTFIRLPIAVGVITNIDPEHLEHYGSFDGLKDAFKTFVENVPFYGFAVACYDHSVVREVVGGVQDRKVITYGITSDAVDVRAVNIREEGYHTTFDVEVLSDRVSGGRRTLEDVGLPMPGVHNVSNALAALSVALELGFDDAVLCRGFSRFEGVKRRFTRTGEVEGVLIIDDYAHHPTEISATLKTARQVADSRGGNVIAVMQPHRYSRLKDLFDEFSWCFDGANHVFISDVFAAGEDPIEGYDRDHLVAAIAKRQYVEVHALQSPDGLARDLSSLVSANDVVVCMGAGTITRWAYDLPDQLAHLYADMISTSSANV